MGAIPLFLCDFPSPPTKADAACPRLQAIAIGADTPWFLPPLPLAHPVAVEAVQHLALALPENQLLLIYILSLQSAYQIHILGTMDTLESIFVFLIILGCLVRVGLMISSRLEKGKESDSGASEWHSRVLKNLLVIIMVMMLINILLYVIN